MVNPTVLICTYQRREITSLNIELLLRHPTVEIVLVVTGDEEKEFYQDKFPNIHVIDYPNKPLGDKWSAGVQVARTLNANPLIILGSDDILGDNFIERCTQLTVDGHDFIGLNEWYIHHQGKAYLCKYQARIPLGGGRCYSSRLLDALDWKIFDTDKNRHLDDYGYDKIFTLQREDLLGMTAGIKDGLEIHAIKGGWSCMNPFTLKHPNIKLISIHESETILPAISGRF